MERTTTFPSEWLIRIIFALSSGLFTGGILYGTQYYAFLADSPSRTEMKQEIISAVTNKPSKWESDKPSVLLMIQNLEQSQKRLFETQDRFIDVLNKQQILLTELNTLMKKQSP